MLKLWSHQFLSIEHLQAEGEREYEGQTHPAPELRIQDPESKKSGVQKLKPPEQSLKICSSKCVLVSVTAPIKGQFFPSGVRNRFSHCSFLRDGFHHRKKLSCIPVDRKNNKGGIKKRKRTGLAREMKNNWKQHLTMRITPSGITQRCGVKAVERERAWKRLQDLLILLKMFI